MRTPAMLAAVAMALLAAAPARADVVAASDPGAALLVRDEGDALCAALDRPALPAECQVPAAAVAFPRILGPVIRSGPARTEVAGIVHETVAAVDLRLGDGRTVRAATLAGDAYTGRYAGHVRFFAVSVPGRARPAQVVLLDASGERLLSVPLVGGEPATGPARTLLTGATPAGRRWRFGALPTARGPCVAVGARLPRSPGDCLTLEPSGRVVFGEADCALHQAVLYGILPAGATGMAGRLADGTTVLARLARAPGARRRAWLLALPPRAEMTALITLGRAGAARSRLALRVLPAARQCGYALFEFL